MIVYRYCLYWGVAGKEALWLCHKCWTQIAIRLTPTPDSLPAKVSFAPFATWQRGFLPQHQDQAQPEPPFARRGSAWAQGGRGWGIRPGFRPALWGPGPSPPLSRERKLRGQQAAPDAKRGCCRLLPAASPFVNCIHHTWDTDPCPAPARGASLLHHLLSNHVSSSPRFRFVGSQGLGARGYWPHAIASLAAEVLLRAH